MAAGNSAKKHPLARWRAIQGWSQQRLADEVGAHQTTITRIESGRLPTLELALKIAAAFPVRVEMIWGKPDHVEEVLRWTERVYEDPEFGARAFRDVVVGRTRQSADTLREMEAVAEQKRNEP